MTRVGPVRHRTAAADGPRDHLVRAPGLDAVPGLLAGHYLVGTVDNLGRHLSRGLGPCRSLLRRGRTSLDLRGALLGRDVSAADRELAPGQQFRQPDLARADAPG